MSSYSSKPLPPLDEFATMLETLFAGTPGNAFATKTFDTGTLGLDIAGTHGSSGEM